MDSNLQAAVEAYIEKRDVARMTPRSAAAWVVQTFGVSAHDLSNAVATSDSLLSQRPQRPSQGMGISTHRNAAPLVSA